MEELTMEEKIKIADYFLPLFMSEEDYATLCKMVQKLKERG